MSGITLHEEHGVNPRLTVCLRCGGEGQDLVLLGIRNYIDTCDKCGCQHVGGAYHGRCQKCSGSVTRRQLKDNEKVPGGLCRKCEAELKEIDNQWEDGGVAFKCEKCGSQGMVKGGSGLAIATREAHTKQSKTGEDFTVKPYKRCGISMPMCLKCDPANKDSGANPG